MTTNEPRATNPEVATRRPENWSPTLNTALDLSVVVLTTLRDAAKISPVPYLFTAASFALSTAEVVQNMQSNQCGFKELAKDSCNIVCEIISAHKGVSRLGDVPVDLKKNLEQLVNVLRSIERFAKKGASRNTIMAVLRSSADAREIRDHKQKLDQAIHVFGFQSDITLRKAMAELAANQVMMNKQLNCISRVVAPPPCSSSSLPSLLLLTNILRGASQNDISVVNFEALFHLENVLDMDSRVISTQITDRQDKKNLIEFVNHVRHAKLLVWSRFKDGDRRAQRLLVLLKHRSITTRNTYRRIKVSVSSFRSRLFKRSKIRSGE